MSGNETKWIWVNQPGADDNANPPIPGHDEEGDSTRALGGAGDGEPVQGTISGFSEPDASDSTMFAGASPAEAIEPVVGWLVVVKGPGIGQSVNMAAGMSTVGRGTDQRISLAFGDNSISRNNHVRMIYDSGSRSFYILPGDGKNLSRVNGELLLDNKRLQGGELIELGDTHLRFVPFCHETFDWADVAAAEQDKPA